MEAYSDISPLWDLSQASSFSQLPDDDFLALLSKQFPSAPGNFSTDFTMNGVNPQTISRYPLPSLTPPSEDSSPSPPQQSGSKSPDDDNDHDLKRKASDDDFDDEGPSHKSQHTCMCILPSSTRVSYLFASVNNGKKGGSTRRKSSAGNGNPVRILFFIKYYWSRAHRYSRMRLV
jgi:AP-1-like factor